MTQTSTNYQIGPVGVNRNNTNGNRTATAFSYQTATTASNSNNSYNNRRSVYANCTAQAATEFRDAIDCGQSLYGNTPIFTTAPGATNQTLAAGVGSFNPNNLDSTTTITSPARSAMSRIRSIWPCAAPSSAALRCA